MSKLYKRYLELKAKDESKIYLFKSGIFYIFIANDAIKMSPLLNLKLSNLNESVVKCGFPVNNLTKYKNIINSLGYFVEIVDNISAAPLSIQNYLLNSKFKEFIEELSSINPDRLSIREAYSLLEDLSIKAKEFIKEMEN